MVSTRSCALLLALCLLLACQSRPPAPPPSGPLSTQAVWPCPRIGNLRDYLKDPRNRFPGANHCQQYKRGRKGLCFGNAAMNVAAASLATYDPGQPADAARMRAALLAMSAGQPATIPGAGSLAGCDRVYGQTFHDAFRAAAIRVQKQQDDPDGYLVAPPSCGRPRPVSEDPLGRIEPLLQAGNAVPLVLELGYEWDDQRDWLTSRSSGKHMVLVVGSQPGLSADQQILTLFDPNFPTATDVQILCNLAKGRCAPWPQQGARTSRSTSVPTPSGPTVDSTQSGSSAAHGRWQNGCCASLRSKVKSGACPTASARAAAR